MLLKGSSGHRAHYPILSGPGTRDAQDRECSASRRPVPHLRRVSFMSFTGNSLSKMDPTMKLATAPTATPEQDTDHCPAVSWKQAQIGEDASG